MADVLNGLGLALFGGGIGWPEVLVILAVVLLLFGGRKLPELARGLARGLRTFRDELKGVKKDLEEDEEEGSASDEAGPKKPELSEKSEKESAEGRQQQGKK